MKNCYLSLILIAFLSSCSNSLFQNEDSSLLALEEQLIQVVSYNIGYMIKR